MTIQGSCLCGSVRYRLDGAFGTITVCHCPDCRKAQGGPVTVAPVHSAELQWIAGTEQITEYESSPDKWRAFCSRCGSPLYSRRGSQPGVLRLRMGSIDTPTDAVPAAHIFAENQPAWAQDDPAIPRYPRHEPGRGG